MPEMSIVQKPCYIEATCWLPYEALVGAIDACLPQDKSKSFLSTTRERALQWYVFHYLLTHEKLNDSISMRLFLMLCSVWFVWYMMHIQMCSLLVKYCFTNHHWNISRKVWWKCRAGQCSTSSMCISFNCVKSFVLCNTLFQGSLICVNTCSFDFVMCWHVNIE